MNAWRTRPVGCVPTSGAMERASLVNFSASTRLLVMAYSRPMYSRGRWKPRISLVAVKYAAIACTVQYIKQLHHSLTTVGITLIPRFLEEKQVMPLFRNSYCSKSDQAQFIAIMFRKLLNDSSSFSFLMKRADIRRLILKLQLLNSSNFVESVQTLVAT